MKKTIITGLLITILLAITSIIIIKLCGRREIIESPKAFDHDELGINEYESPKASDYDELGINEYPKTFNYEELGINEYEYPNEFIMNDSLKRIVASLAFWYGDYDVEKAKSDEWKESFIARFIQNSMFSFDYLDELNQRNGGKVTVEQINYINYSITNTEIDYSDIVEEYIDCRDNASFLNHAFMDEYEYEIKGDHVIVTGIVDVEYQGSVDVDQYDIVADLIKNPYSCFDGYSIVSIKSAEITQ